MNPFLLPQRTLVFEGDSLTRRNMPPSSDTWPLLRMNNWHHSWADLVEEWIFAHRPDLQIKCRQAAIGGSSIFEMEQRYESQVKPHQPSGILFTLSTNDFSRQIPLDEFRTHLTSYIQTAQTDSGARFFYVGGFRPMPGLPEADMARISGAQTYAQIVREVVRDSGGLAPEIDVVMKEKAEQHFAASSYHSFYGDGDHFSSLGNHVLAGIVLEHLGIFTATS